MGTHYPITVAAVLQMLIVRGAEASETASHWYKDCKFECMNATNLRVFQK